MQLSITDHDGDTLKVELGMGEHPGINFTINDDLTVSLQPHELCVLMAAMASYMDLAASHAE